MPLHLLGKKSWNVYNSENIARVQRDEATAQAKEEEQERRMQEADAEHRLTLLRGTALPCVEPPEPHSSHVRCEQEKSHHRKRRRLEGEDDTERDIRLAREDAEDKLHYAQSLSRETPAESIIDLTGHINLIPDSNKRRFDKNDEAEEEAKNKRRELEDQYTMRFSNAAGHRPGSGTPWYTQTGHPDLAASSGMSKDVWGNEDSGRRERDRQRMSSGDPLAAMKKGLKQLRDAQSHRREWRAQRERDLNEVEELARRHPSNRRRRSSESGVDDFNLDEPHPRSRKTPPDMTQESDMRHRRHHHRHRHRHVSNHADRGPRRDRSRPSRRYDTRRSPSPKVTS